MDKYIPTREYIHASNQENFGDNLLNLVDKSGDLNLRIKNDSSKYILNISNGDYCTEALLPLDSNAKDIERNIKLLTSSLLTQILRSKSS